MKSRIERCNTVTLVSTKCQRKQSDGGKPNISRLTSVLFYIDGIMALSPDGSKATIKPLQFYFSLPPTLSSYVLSLLFILYCSADS